MVIIVLVVALGMTLLVMVGMILLFTRKQFESKKPEVKISDTMEERPLKFPIRPETGTFSEQQRLPTSSSELRIKAECLQRDPSASRKVSEFGASLPRPYPQAGRNADGMNSCSVNGSQIGPSKVPEDSLVQGIHIESSFSMSEDTLSEGFSPTSIVVPSPVMARVSSSSKALSSPLRDESTDMSSARESPGSSSGIIFSELSVNNTASPSIASPLKSPVPPPPPTPPAPPPPPPRLPGRPVKKVALSKPSMINLAPLRKNFLTPVPSSGPAPQNSEDQGFENNSESPRKLKPLYWDTIKADLDASMVWSRLSGSFEPDERMIEILFGFNRRSSMKKPDSVQSPSRNPERQNHLLPYRKAQNIAIQLRALNVTKDEIRSSLLEGRGLSSEILEALIKMEPTREEEQRLREYVGNPCKLGTAEHFLKNIIEIPCAFRRLNAMLYMATFKEELEQVHESLDVLEGACRELMNNHTFAKILEVVLKTGNRMNKGTLRGGARAFKIDVLLKLADVKGVDGKTTLLHFVVEEILISEGERAARLLGESSCTADHSDERNSCNNYRQLGSKAISGLISGLPNVKRAAGMDLAVLREIVSKLVDGLQGLKDDLRSQYKECNTTWPGSYQFPSPDVFSDFIASFLEDAEVDLDALKGEMKKVSEIIQKTNTYFYGDLVKEEANSLSLFTVVKTFLPMLNQACNDVMKIDTRRA